VHISHFCACGNAVSATLGKRWRDVDQTLAFGQWVCICAIRLRRDDEDATLSCGSYRCCRGVVRGVVPDSRSARHG